LLDFRFEFFLFSRHDYLAKNRGNNKDASRQDCKRFRPSTWPSWDFASPV